MACADSSENRSGKCRKFACWLEKNCSLQKFEIFLPKTENSKMIFAKAFAKIKMFGQFSGKLKLI
jgi:hypothetical protein